MTAPTLQGGPSVTQLCRWAGLSRASYYRYWQEAPSRAEEVLLQADIQRLALENPRYGYRRIHALLKREGSPAGVKLVRRLMREDNLLCLPQRPFVPVTTQSRHEWQIVPNLIRDLRLSAPDQLWVADITYIRLAEDFIYLAVVLDAFSRRVIGWALAAHLRAELAIEALTMALTARRPAPASLIHHSDRGVQYACNDYVAILKAHGIRQSMSRVGNPYDNAKAERFMRTLKEEEVDGRAYKDMSDARQRIGSFIEDVYNRQRLHSALDYLSPTEYEERLQRSV